MPCARLAGSGFVKPQSVQPMKLIPLPQILPSSRRFTRDRWHPYGHEVIFRQSIRWPSGKITRHVFRDIGVNRSAAIGNSLRHLQALAEAGEQEATRRSLAVAKLLAPIE